MKFEDLLRKYMEEKTPVKINCIGETCQILGIDSDFVICQVTEVNDKKEEQTEIINVLKSEVKVISEGKKKVNQILKAVEGETNGN